MMGGLFSTGGDSPPGNPFQVIISSNIWAPLSPSIRDRHAGEGAGRGEVGRALSPLENLAVTVFSSIHGC